MIKEGFESTLPVVWICSLPVYRDQMLPLIMNSFNEKYLEQLKSTNQKQI